MFYLLSFLSCVLLIFWDQITKLWTVDYFKFEGPYKSIIDGFFQLTFLKNDGAAWGILKGGRIFFIIVTVVVVLVLIAYYFKIKKSEKSWVIKISIIMIVAGAVGNLIDRFRLGYVIDMLHFIFKDYSFPVFNFADIYVVVGTALFIIYVIFLSDEDGFDLKGND